MKTEIEMLEADMDKALVAICQLNLLLESAKANDDQNEIKLIEWKLKQNTKKYTNMQWRFDDMGGVANKGSPEEINKQLIDLLHQPLSHEEVMSQECDGNWEVEKQ